MERFAKRHRKSLNELLGTHVAKPPSDSTFRLLLSQLDVDGFDTLQQPTLASPSLSTAWCVTARLCGVRLIKPPLAQRVLSPR